MGVIYFLICVRKHESNLSTNICTTAGKETQWYREKCGLLSEITFLPDFITAWHVFVYQTLKCVFLSQLQHYVSMILENSVRKKIHTLPRCGLIFPSQMPDFLHWLLSGTLPTQLKPP